MTGELLNPLAQKREDEKTLPPLVQVLPEPDIEIPSAPSGRPPFRKIEGSLFLPEPIATDVQRHAVEMDARIQPPRPSRDEEELSDQSQEMDEQFPFLGGEGVPSPLIRAEAEEAEETAEAEEAEETEAMD